MGDKKGIIGRIVSAGQSAATDFTDEFLGNPKFANMLKSAVSRARNVRKTFDKNLQLAFNTLNLPTRADYVNLLGKIDKMNKAVSDLESRIDDLVVAARRLASSGSKTARKK